MCEQIIREHLLLIQESGKEVVVFERTIRTNDETERNTASFIFPAFSAEKRKLC